jgi:sigma-E factor negative regulatory protein RseB
VNRLIALFFVGLLAHPVNADEVSDWLMKMEMAPDKVSYTGSFIYDHDGQMETMRIVHFVEQDNFRERLYSLTGSAREIIRDREKVWCYLPEKKIGVHENRQVSRNAFLQIRGGQIADLDNHYDLTLGVQERIADRLTQVLKISPRDRFRYGYQLWVDNETGLLLRADLQSRDGKTIEKYMFVEVQINPVIDESMLQPRTSKESLSWFGVDNDPDVADSTIAMIWDSATLPAGFSLAQSITRRSPMENGVVEHHVYSDGLSNVSLFVKKIGQGKGMDLGYSKMGAVSAFTVMQDGFQVAVVGEVPESTVRMIAQGVRRNP